MIETSQQEFHAMRGHVRDGTIVNMDNGDTAKIRAEMRGWVVETEQGRSEQMQTAAEVEFYIVHYRAINEPAQ